ncbi:MAG: replicative DNA helicase [Rhodobacterales bacterium 12-64-8]|nr:MAG: replicative DNA helicase [Rhodobacterales bacterium 12-64-8]OYX51311.1 MAG: replicative DNA helicase [Alphaproteobacteria bacterium 32-64-14]
MPKDHESTQQIAPPHNLQAEMAVLGAILFDNNAHQRVSDVVKPRDFYAPANQTIFEVLDRMISNGRVADGVTLKEHFERDGKLVDIGGARYLADLLDSAAFGPEIIDYARLVHDLSLRRELIDIGAGMVSKAARGELEEPGEIQIQDAERKLFSLAERGAGAQGFKTFNSALTTSIETATAAFKRDGKIAGVPSGLTELDRKLGGLHKSDLVILAARPSMGKTALATNIAYYAAKNIRRSQGSNGQMKTDEGAVVGFFSLEMSSDQLASRILADVSGVPSDKMRRGELSHQDYESIRNAAEEMEGIPLYIDDTGGISISQLAARARRLQRTSGLDLLIIDYLQLITSSGGRKSDGRVQEVTEITKSLKALAKELAIPIIALSQLSRAVEQREDKRPQLSDLRESGSIEQDADVVMFIYREAYYLERLEPDISDPRHAEWKDAMAQKFNVAEIIISKQRHGPIGKVEVGFNPARVKFSNLDHTPGRAQSGWQGGGGGSGVGSGGGGSGANKPFLPDGEE